MTGSLTEGQWILALGYPTPHGEFAVNPGVISSFVTVGNVRRGIRTDADIDRGYSGGPALTDRGEVAGVATRIEFGDLTDATQLLTADALKRLVNELLSEKPGHQSECGVSTDPAGPYATPFTTEIAAPDGVDFDDSTTPGVTLVDVSPSVATPGDSVTVTWRVTDDIGVVVLNPAPLTGICQYGSETMADLAARGGAFFTPTTMIDGGRHFGFPDPSVGPPLICATETPRVEGEERHGTFAAELTVPPGAVGYYGLQVNAFDHDVRTRINRYMNQLLVVAD